MAELPFKSYLHVFYLFTPFSHTLHLFFDVLIFTRLSGLRADVKNHVALFIFFKIKRIETGWVEQETQKRSSENRNPTGNKM